MIEGHVNFGPKPADALKLSTSRAETVMAKLEDMGVAKLRMSAAGFGFDRPRCVHLLIGTKKIMFGQL